MRRTALFLMVFFALLAGAQARSGHITALAVVNENETTGGTADIFLELRPGTGAVYIESFPLTKLDTQVSTRLAKEIACQRASVDCSQYDFFYLINVRSSVVGGPSAGGAITVLTYALLEDLPIDNETAMTGSILSGGIIGPVGGVEAKVSAAEKEGYKQVLIPAWEDSESSIPLEDKHNINVIRVRNIDQAIAVFTGTQVHIQEPVQVPAEYTAGMEQVSASLCEHAHILLGAIDDNTTNATRSAQTQYERGLNATGSQAYYSAASLCFSSALTSQTQIFEEKTPAERQEILTQILADREKLETALKDTKAESISDVEINMVVSERLHDVRARITAINTTDPEPALLAYSYERLETARAWFSMRGKVPSKKVEITPARVALSCSAKLAEAQERVNYLSYLYPKFTSSLEDSLREAAAAAEEQDYFLCLLQASQAKAEANALLSALYVPEDEFHGVISEKLAASDAQLVKQGESGTFPILAYSYNEYSKSLLASEPYSAALYTEYSLELGMLDIYFPPKRSSVVIDKKLLFIFVTGVAFGLLFGIGITQMVGKPQKTHQSKKVTFARNLPGKKR